MTVAEVWDETRRARQAARLVEVARQIPNGRAGVGQLRANRLYRKALRILKRNLPDAPHAGAGDGGAGDGAAPRPMWEEVDRRRSEMGVRGWIRNRPALTGRQRRAAIVATTGMALLVVVVPGLRRVVFGHDVAAGQSWTASSASDGFPATGTVADDPKAQAMFHTAEEMWPSLVVDLGSAQKIHRVRVENRHDCCRERALPLLIEVSADGRNWRRVAYRRIPFTTWTAQFDRTTARLVRLRVDRMSILHLRTVAVF